jgi:L-ascorbate metabolism protein UlaG (beta-lactamase superfamily)
MIDPYFSDCVAKVHPENTRRVPIDARFLNMTPDVLVFTHDHLDHYDPETAPLYFAKTDKQMTVLCPSSIWQKARVHGGGHNYVVFDRGTEWTAGDVRLRAVKAAHSEPFAIGVIIEDLTDGRKYYITGDTLYNSEIFADLPKDIDLVFLPINGVGNNMNEVDAVRFFKKSGARAAVPYHVGMFDEKSPELFDADNRVILEIYKETEM